MHLRHLAHRYADNAAARVVDISADGTRRELSHQQLFDLVERRTEILREAGVLTGHTVGLLAANGIDWISWDLAALATGAVLHAFPHEPSTPTAAELVDGHDLALLITDRPQDRESELGCVVPADASAPGAVARSAAARHDDGDLHSLVYSSGTTGALKGLMISRKGTEYVIDRFLDRFRVGDGDRHLIFLPLANYQQRLSVYCCLWTGADLVLAPYQRVFGALASERPTFVIAPPVFYDAALQLHRRTGGGSGLAEFLGGRIRFMITGMAPISRQTLDGYWGQGVKLLEAYGMTESGMIAWNTEDAHRVGTVGRFIDDAVEIRPDGELVIRRSAPLSLGYFASDEATAAETFLPDGAIASGDFGRLDADGYLVLVGRKKDLVVLSSGRKVHPAEIEALFADVEGVADLVVVPAPGAAHLGAIITPARSGDGDGDGDEKDQARLLAAIAGRNLQVEAHQRLASVAFSPRPLRSDPRFLTKNLKLSRQAAAEFFAGEADRTRVAPSAAVTGAPA